MYDLAILGGKIFDGNGNPWVYGDVAIKDGRIVSIVRRHPDDPSPFLGLAQETIDAEGRAVSPGFVDMHSHSDFPLLINPTADGKVMQGVTTEVIGQCGHSLAPIDERSLEIAKNSLRGMPQIEWDWRSYGGYLDRLERQGVSLNVAGVVGHGTVRTTVMQYANRPPTSEELQRMKQLVTESLEEGAFGLSTGLIYTPGSYSGTEELIEIARAAQKVGGVYFTHMRGEGEAVFDSVAEALRIGREARIPVQVAHLKAYGLARGKAQQLLSMLEEARCDGVDITADQYPYIASSTGLSALLPPWAHEGGRERLLERLSDTSVRAQMRADMSTRIMGWGNDFRGVPWSDVQIANCKDISYVGKRVQQIADEESKDPWEVVFDTLGRVDLNTAIVVFGIDANDAELIMKAGFVTVGSDGSALNPQGPLGQGQPHPRNYGTMPRVLGKYVREDKVISLEEAIRKMTGGQAARLNLKDRGQLREGFWADITVFDPDTIEDLATFEKPHRFPRGIDYVIVNGKVTVERGKHTGALSGKVLRRA